jgi:hypothetical protein
MNTEKKVAIIAGILFIVATTASLLGSGLVGPLLKAPDYIGKVSSNGNQMIVGTLLSFLAAATSAGIAIALYPVLKKFRAGLALGAVGFRIIEGVFYMIGAMCLLSVFSLTQHFASAGGQNASAYETIGDLLLTMHDLAGFVFGVFAFCIGAFMYYLAFYQSKLVPRWLSVWGIIALALLLVAVFLTLFDGEPYSISGNLIYLALPIALQEMVLAVWLIVKGFDPAVIAKSQSEV